MEERRASSYYNFEEVTGDEMHRLQSSKYLKPCLRIIVILSYNT